MLAQLLDAFPESVASTVRKSLAFTGYQRLLRVSQDGSQLDPNSITTAASWFTKTVDDILRDYNASSSRVPQDTTQYALYHSRAWKTNVIRLKDCGNDSLVKGYSGVYVNVHCAYAFF